MNNLPRKLLIGLSRGYAAPIGVAIIIGSSLGYYYCYYKYHQLGYVLFGGLFLGFFVLRTSITGSLYTTRRYANYSGKTSVKQTLIRVIGLIITVGLIIVTNLKIVAAEANREKDIMASQPTAFTTAMVTGITTTHNKGSTYYYAQFKYTANSKVILQETPDDNGYLVAGKTYKLKYSVQYPEMFVIYGR